MDQRLLQIKTESINKENFITSNPTRVETLIIFGDVSARVEGSCQLFKEGGKGSESGEEGEGEGGGGVSRSPFTRNVMNFS